MEYPHIQYTKRQIEKLTMNTMFGATMLADIPGMIKDIIEKMGGKNGLDWFRIFRYVIKNGRDATFEKLRKADVWKKIKIGGICVGDILTSDRWKESFATTQFSGKMVNLVRNDLPVIPNEGEIEFVKGTLKDLFCLVDNISVENLISKEWLESNGFEACMKSDAFFLRYYYTDQPNGEEVFIGMNPLVVELDNGSTAYAIFTLERPSLSVDFLRQTLGGSNIVSGERKCTPDSVWIFRKLKTPIEKPTT